MNKENFRIIVVIITNKEEINKISIKYLSKEQITSIVRYTSDSVGYTPFKFLAVMYALNELDFEEKNLGLCKITYKCQPTNTEAFCLPHEYVLK